MRNWKEIIDDLDRKNRNADDYFRQRNVVLDMSQPDTGQEWSKGEYAEPSPDHSRPVEQMVLDTLVPNPKPLGTVPEKSLVDQMRIHWEGMERKHPVFGGISLDEAVEILPRPAILRKRLERIRRQAMKTLKEEMSQNYPIVCRGDAPTIVDLQGGQDD